MRLPPPRIHEDDMDLFDASDSEVVESVLHSRQLSLDALSDEGFKS